MSQTQNINQKPSLWKRFFLVCCVISVVTGGVFFLMYNQQNSLKSFLIFVLTAASYTFPIAFANGWINEFLDKKYSWVEDTQRRLVWGIFATVLINAAVIFGRNYIDFILIQKQKPEEFFTGTMGIYNFLVLGVALFISVVLHARGFILDWKKTSKQQVTEQKIIAKSANAQFVSLKNQLDPHFLFNSLNVLDSLIEENPVQAQKFTNSMSKIYRYVLDQKDKELVTVEEEMNFAKTYCELLKTRFEDSLNFSFEVSDEEKNKFVVPLSLQLLLENAIKHNFATSQNPLNVKIYSQDNQLIVENNLQQREVLSEREGIGLSNIVQRYALLTTDNVKIENSEEKFKVKIPILTEKITAMNTPNSTTNPAYERAVNRVRQIKKFYGNLAAYCIIIPLLFIMNWRDDHTYWWAFWPMFGWGVGLAIQAVQTFGIGKDWEERKINELVKKYENNGN